MAYEPGWQDYLPPQTQQFVERLIGAQETNRYRGDDMVRYFLGALSMERTWVAQLTLPVLMPMGLGELQERLQRLGNRGEAVTEIMAGSVYKKQLKGGAGPHIDNIEVAVCRYYADRGEDYGARLLSHEHKDKLLVSKSLPELSEPTAHASVLSRVFGHLSGISVAPATVRP